MTRRELPRSFVARIAALASMPETDMVQILNRMVADGYVTRVRKGEAYLFSNLPQPAPDRPAPPIVRAVANAQQRIRQRTTEPPAQTITAAAIPGAARKMIATGKRHRTTRTGGAPPVKQVLADMERQRRQPPPEE